ncbi:MAG: hypothetical protein QOG77_1108 [Solirubrobacteraceae bacterium]|jgi:hypothetical protein|nr:hypothetical protein [Solirubrobacteraceae bacterium]
MVPARRIALLAVALVGAAASPASAAVPYTDIVTAGPLTSVALGNELGCQVAHTGDAGLELFPSSAKPGDCGTFVALGATLFAPNFAAHDSTAASSVGASTPWTPVSQTPVTGAGTSASPYRVVTAADAGATGLRVVQADTYVVGQESYRTDVTVQNRTGGPQSGVLYRAGDCYLQSSDTGFGFVDAPRSGVGCSVNANNAPAGRIEQWFPITGGATFMEARYSDVWAHIATRTPFPNTTRAAESLDNGAGISWSFAVPAGGESTYSHYTTFSPQGIAGPPSTAVPSTAFGRTGIIDAPSNRSCVSRRYFRIRLRRAYWPSIVGVTVQLRGLTRVLRRAPWGTIVDLRGLPRGRFAVDITALTTTGRAIRGTRRYRTCAGRLRGGRPPL